MTTIVVKTFQTYRQFQVLLFRKLGSEANGKNTYVSGGNARKKPIVKHSQSIVNESHPVKNRPFTLPPGLYRPKQSLGQNFLSDQNYVLKIVDAFSDNSEKGKRVVEIGPGPGALTRELVKRYPDMSAVEIDERGVKFLNDKLPGLNIIHMDILKYDWAQAAIDKGGPLNVIANLPYGIVSQVLFGLADSHKAISKAVVTMQLEVAQRITAQANTKDYGIPSVIFQLYGETKINFHIPPKVFYPVPNVDSALVTIDFTKPNRNLHCVDGDKLRRVVSLSFRQRRKMMRQSLKEFLNLENVSIPEKWGTRRPEQLRPDQFIELTAELFGELSAEESAALKRDYKVDQLTGVEGGDLAVTDKSVYQTNAIWRKALYPDMHLSNKMKEKKLSKQNRPQSEDNWDDISDDDFEGDVEEEGDISELAKKIDIKPKVRSIKGVKYIDFKGFDL